MADLVSEKQRQYNAAMEKYDKIPVYVWIGRVVSFVNVGGQAVLGVLVFHISIGFVRQVLAFATAFILADFVNGLVHMYMDNADDYLSPVGPLIAAFHLHHRTPAYKIKPLAAVYYHEFGSKIWLAFFRLPLSRLFGLAEWPVLPNGEYFIFLSCRLLRRFLIISATCRTPTRSSGSLAGLGY